MISTRFAIGAIGLLALGFAVHHLRPSQANDQAIVANLAESTSRKSPDAKRGITVLGSTPTTVDEAVLFSFDDVSIPYTANLYLTMTEPERHPNNPLIPIGQPGEPDEWSVQCYGSVIKQDGKYKLWYIALDEECLKVMGTGKHVDYRGARVAYAESDDGVTWTKPKLGLVDYHGSKANNLVLMDPPQAHGLDVLVLYEPDDPDPARRYKMMLHMGARFDDIPAGAPIPFFSADGLRWKVANGAKLLDYTVASDETAIPPEHFEMGGLYKWNGMYHLNGQQVTPFMWLSDGADCGRILTTFRSSDFVNWSETKTLSFVRNGNQPLKPPASLNDGEQVHQNSVWNRGNVLIATHGLWHGGDPGSAAWDDVTVDLGLTVSNDGLRFREPIADHVFISRGEDGQWDQGGLLMSQAFENIGDKTFIYYGHWDPRVGRSYNKRGGFGAVTFPCDRFASLSTKKKDKNASLVTCAIETDEPPQLFVNADGLGKDSWLRIEVLDELERPIAEFSGEHSAKVTEAGFRQPIDFGSKQRIDQIEGPFKIKVTFEGENKESIKFYALYLTK